MTRYYFDTEFDDNQTTGRINLISIGIVCDDGRELYLINKDCDHSVCNDWVKVNVLPKLVARDSTLMRADGENIVPDGPVWRTHAEIRDAVQAFIVDDGNPVEIWAYFASYDWIIFCQLFGEMVNLPKHFPKFVRDLKTWALDIGYKGKFRDLLPDTGHHDALADARWNRDVHKILLKRQSRIVLDVPTGLSAEEASHVRQILRDAIGEFISVRSGPGLDEPADTLTYVNKRYFELTGYARECKIDEVMLRKAIARKLRRAVDDIEIE